MIPADNIKDDDIFEDDFDLDGDFEDDFDLDDSDTDVLDAGVSSDALGVASSSQPTANKSFLQKFFIPIVIGVVALFGFLFVMGQGLLFGSNNSAPIATPEEEYIATNIELEPEQPVIADATEPTTENKNQLLDPLATIEQEPLMPLPGDNTDADAPLNFELVDLDAALEENDVATPSENNTVLAMESMPLLDETSNIEAENLMPEPIAAAPLIEDVTETAIAEEDSILETLQPETQALSDPFAPAGDLNIEPAPVILAPTVLSEATELTDEMTILRREKEELLKEKAMLADEIRANQAMLAELKASVRNLESQSAATETIIVSDPIVETITLSPPVINEVISTPIQQKAAPKKVIKKAPRWVLKSAQPGKAVIAVKGSHDMKNIEVGQRVSGLGRIKSIKVENGLWVVRGSNGRISQ